MIEALLFLLLPIAAASGWFARQFQDNQSNQKKIVDVSRQYIRGLNFLLNEQNDKAIQAFIAVLEVDSETVETHLALGNLFRRQGEVERAIRIHQNLVARPNLSKEHQHFALLELGQDYFAAGLFDRAESIFNQLLNDGYYSQFAINQLLQIYESTKDWFDAIDLINKQSKSVQQDYLVRLSHYWCEVANDAINNAKKKEAKKAIDQALKAHSVSPRARLLEIEYLIQYARTNNIISSLNKFGQFQTKYLGLVIEQAEAFFIHNNLKNEYKKFLDDAIERGAGVSVALTLALFLKQIEGEKSAIVFLSQYLKNHPSLKGLQQLITWHKSVAGAVAQSSLELLESIVNQLISTKPLYRCDSCGFSGKQLHWQCPSCKNWETYQPIIGIEGE
jgi:lipopolysaccharide assembly protein B